MTEDAGAQPRSIALSLISHTNAGKTTLARTLLGRDVGEIRDAPHVTQEATPYPMLATPEGDALVLWDTPGFGDSVRLARRLAQQGNPIGWFLSEVWDRFRDRTFWLSQQAVRNVRDQADIVLYLVNAGEAPEESGYLEPELDVLGWIGKPVVVLLNQTGPPRPAEDEAAEEARWQAAFATRPFVKHVLSLDAFARCWVQELELLRSLVALVEADKREAMDRLAQAWQERRRGQFEQAMAELAEPLVATALDSEKVPAAGFIDKAGGFMRSIFRPDDAKDPRNDASEALAARLDTRIRASTDRLIALHGLDGHASRTVLERLASSTALEAPVDERKGAMMGGVLGGALTGLAADLAAGGLTLGAGLLTGAVIGALGGAGVAHGMNRVQGRNEIILRWDDAFLDSLVTAALLRYLAIAHYGRGRGQWVESEYPPFWAPLVGEVVGARRPGFAAIWKMRSDPAAGEAMQRDLQAALSEAGADVLRRLYPAALAAAT